MTNQMFNPNMNANLHHCMYEHTPAFTRPRIDTAIWDYSYLCGSTPYFTMGNMSSSSDDLTESFSALSVSPNQPRHGRPSKQVYSKKKLQKLYGKAEMYLESKSCKMRLCRDLYRDKSRDYFQDIIHEQRSIMRPYIKDCHGDPKSPVNNRINGLFFAANVNRRTGQPQEPSIYGERRFLITPDRIMDIAPNAYFTDFYCVHNDTHYVTLVLTSPGSDTDRFCKKRLIPFDIENNPFFCVVTDRNGNRRFKVTDGLWVEILVTEPINVTDEVRLRNASWKNVEMKGRRSGGKTGLVKNLNCPDCNL